MKNAAEFFGENDKRTQNWQIQLNNAEAALNGIEREVEQNNAALKKTAEEFDDAEKQADEFGDEVKDAGDDAVTAAVNYTDSMVTLKRTFSGVKNQISAELQPGSQSPCLRWFPRLCRRSCPLRKL